MKKRYLFIMITVIILVLIVMAIAFINPKTIKVTNISTNEIHRVKKGDKINLMRRIRNTRCKTNIYNSKT